MDYNKTIDKATHDSQVILNNLLDELFDEYHHLAGMKTIIKNEFRGRMEVWARFEKGQVNGKN